MEVLSPELPEKENPNGPDLGFSMLNQGIVAPRPAGFIRRAIAYSMDMAIIFFLFLFFIYWGLMGMHLSGGLDLFFNSTTEGIFPLSFVFLYTGYFAFFHAYGGQTPAKMIMRIMVVNKKGLPPSYFRALMRSFGLFFSHLFFGFGFFMVIIEPKKRALHDLLTGTQVMLSP